MLQVAKKQDALNEYASVVALSYVAAQRTFFGYNDMADAKSLLESIARSFGYIYGREKHVRINTIPKAPRPQRQATVSRGWITSWISPTRCRPSATHLPKNVLTIPS